MRYLNNYPATSRRVLLETSAVPQSRNSPTVCGTKTLSLWWWAPATVHILSMMNPAHTLWHSFKIWKYINFYCSHNMASFVWLNLEEHMFACFVITNNVYIYVYIQDLLILRLNTWLYSSWLTICTVKQAFKTHMTACWFFIFIAFVLVYDGYLVVYWIRVFLRNLLNIFAHFMQE